MKISHEQRAGNSLPGDIREDEGEARGSEVEEIVVVATDLASLHTGARVVEGGERRKDLREKAGLDVAGDVHFVSGATFGFHAVGNVLGKTNILQSNGGLSSNGIEEVPVFAGVRLFRKRLAKNEKANEMSAMADERHETFGGERSERKILRGIDGARRRNIPGTSASG